MFDYRDKKFKHFWHPYNWTHTNERQVELPVVFDWLSRREGKGLEVGNVTPNYLPPRHKVIDIMEKAPHIDNENLFDVTGKYDWVLAISTIEHVGWDNEVGLRSPVDAVVHLRSILQPGGSMLLTVPVGYNWTLDECLVDGLGADRWGCVYRGDGEWLYKDGFKWEPYTIGACSVWFGEWGLE